MEHRYTSDQHMAGLWIHPDGSGSEFCRWRWNPGLRELTVERDGVTRRWAANNIGGLVLRRIVRQLPEIARDIAEKIPETSNQLR